eukprot:Partr_v1_DN27317_c0_g1_i2_m46539 putative Small nuclear RNA activating complex, polypeptide 4, 190kDa
MSLEAADMLMENLFSDINFADSHQTLNLQNDDEILASNEIFPSTNEDQKWDDISAPSDFLNTFEDSPNISALSPPTYQEPSLAYTLNLNDVAHHYIDSSPAVNLNNSSSYLDSSPSMTEINPEPRHLSNPDLHSLAFSYEKLQQQSLMKQYQQGVIRNTTIPSMRMGVYGQQGLQNNHAMSRIMMAGYQSTNGNQQNVLPNNNQSISYILGRARKSAIKSPWTKEEDQLLLKGFEMYPRQWAKISCMIPGRTNQQVKQRYSYVLNENIVNGPWSEFEDSLLIEGVRIHGNLWAKVAQLIPGRTNIQCRNRWKDVLDPSIRSDPWTEQEDETLRRGFSEYGNKWTKISSLLPGRTGLQCRDRFLRKNCPKSSRR